MRTPAVAQRYGKAAFELAIEEGAVEALACDIAGLDAALEGLPAIVAALSDERVDRVRREAVARAIADDLGLGTIGRNLALVLLQRDRAALLPAVVRDIAARLRARERLLLAHAQVADGRFAPELARHLEETLSEALAGRVRCEVREKPSLIGGFTVAIGDEHFDASVKGRFARMKERLL